MTGRRNTDLDSPKTGLLGLFLHFDSHLLMPKHHSSLTLPIYMP